MYGGIPSPNPSYPQDVKVVTGDNQVDVVNKNLFNGIWELGYINGNTGQNASNDSLMRGKDYIPVEELTNYKISTDSTDFTIMLVYEYKEDFSYNLTINKGITMATEYLTTNANTRYIRIRPGSLSTVDLNIKVQVEKGTVATSYVEHQEQTYTLHLGSLELCKIGDYQDYITGTKDNWKVVRNVGKVTFVGPENWQRSTNYTNTTMYYLEHGLSNIVADPFLSNYFTFMLGNDDIPHIRWGGTGNSRFLIFSPILNDIDSFKSWLSTHNTIVYYELATPIEETITDTTLINDLNNLQDLLSYDGTTNITITSASSNAQMIVEVTYTSESDMNEKLTNIFNSIKSKLYHIIRAL